MEYLEKNNIEPKNVLELGCFDGKLINFFKNKPLSYVGFDANWEGGLDIANEEFKNSHFAKFYKSTEPKHLDVLKEKKFDVGFCMETFEHIPPNLVEPYLIKLREHVRDFLIITVPNEKGVFFLIKYLIKLIFMKLPQPYTFKEIIYSIIGMSKKVQRNQHKGFDYDDLAKKISKYFNIIKFSGHPFGFLPKELCFGISIVCVPKK